MNNNYLFCTQQKILSLYTWVDFFMITTFGVALILSLT